MTLRPSRCLALWPGPTLLLLSWFTPAQALAQPNLRVVLEYSADPALACPSAAELSASVTKQLGYDSFTTDTSEPRLRIVISKQAERAAAQIEWFDRQQRSEGERRLLSDGNCAELVSNLAFAVAVQIQLHAAADTAPPPAAPAVPPPPPAAPAKRPPKTVPPVSNRPAVFLGAGALVRHGLSPGLSPGVRVFGALSTDRWVLELSAHTTLPSELRQTDGTGFTSRELGASFAPCLHRPPIGLCAVATLSLLHVRGQGVDQIRSPSSATAGFGGRLQLRWPALERFGIVAQGEALAVLFPREVLVNQQSVWSTAPLVFTAILDFAAIFR
ncbi:MAG TPA: hypothetical protein VHP33_24805 [Polyangiaceae bacterium]|nr:hypothetical protein [Polyangiaceae bacterium]